MSDSNTIRQDINDTNLDRASYNNEGSANSKWVINLSKDSLTQAQRSVLAKGPNFSLAPINIPSIEYTTAVESMCTKLKEEDAMELRADGNALLRRAKAPKSNITREERKGLAQLKRTRIR